MKRIALFLVAALLFLVSLASCEFSFADSKATLPPETQAPTAASTAASTESETEEDKTVPDFYVLDKNEKAVHLSDFFGKPIILNFWATWCGLCKAELPDFEEMYKVYGNRIQFLMVDMTDGTQETMAGAKLFVDAQGYTFPVYFDVSASAATAYGVASIPTTFFINEKGELVTYAVGRLNAETLQKGIDMLLPEN